LVGTATGNNLGAPVPSLAELRGKTVHSVDEVEADIKQMVNMQDGFQRPPQAFISQKQHHPTQIEMSPFEKFVSCSLVLLTERPQVKNIAKFLLSPHLVSQSQS
jgi:hypothetical protein